MTKGGKREKERWEGQRQGEGMGRMERWGEIEFKGRG